MKPRTGFSVGAITVASLVAAAVIPPAQADGPAEEGLIAHYTFGSLSDGVVADESGHGNVATVRGDVVIQGSRAVFPGTRTNSDYLALPDGLLEEAEAATVSLEIKPDPDALQTYSFLWNIGGTSDPNNRGASTGSWFLTARSSLRTAVTPQRWEDEKSASAGETLVADQWQNVTATIMPNSDQTSTLVLYIDGTETARLENSTVGLSDLTAHDRNRIGGSAYDGDRDLAATVSEVRIWDRALTAEEVSHVAVETAVPVSDEGLAGVLDSIDLGDVDGLTGDLQLPGTVKWSSSDPDVVTDEGHVTRPQPGGDPITVTLTATANWRGYEGSREFSVTVLPAESTQLKVEADLAALDIHDSETLRHAVTLPTVGPEYGSQVSWALADDSVLKLVADEHGTHLEPVRPAYGHPAVTSAVTATVTQDGETRIREFPVTVQPLARAVPNEAYAFSYFTANTIEGEKIYLAASEGNNALEWNELNDGQPILESEYGERGLRDPFIIRSHEGDKFFLIATDLSIGRNGDWNRAQTRGSQYLEIWESTDLVNWSEQRHVKVAPDNAGMLWAPEAYYDEERAEYVVFWASRLFTGEDRNQCIEPGCYARMMYATTKDFVTFSEAQIWQDTQIARIDSTVLKEGDYYYRYTKDEGRAYGSLDIFAERSTDLQSVTTAENEGWEFLGHSISRNAGVNAGVEGPTVFKANEGDTSGYGYYLYLDDFGGRGYFPLGSNDLAANVWETVDGNLPSSRHGTVIPVSNNEWNSLTGNELTVTGSQTTASYQQDDRVLDIEVAAADGYQVGGIVTVRAGNWEQQAYLGQDATTSVDGSLTDGARQGNIRLSIPDGVSGTVEILYAGTPEIEPSSASAVIPGSQIPGGGSDDPDPDDSGTDQDDDTQEPGADDSSQPVLPDRMGDTGLGSLGLWTLLALILAASGAILVLRRHRNPDTRSSG